LNAEYLGDAEICIDKKLLSIMGDSEDNYTNRSQLAKMKKALAEVIQNEISARQREIIVLYYYKRMNIPEIADMLGVNKSTVSRTLSRARRTILSRLKYMV
jgi:RNA polymerase sigma factor (sigma-70 family)